MKQIVKWTVIGVVLVEVILAWFHAPFVSILLVIGTLAGLIVLGAFLMVIKWIIADRRHERETIERIVNGSRLPAYNPFPDDNCSVLPPSQPTGYSFPIPPEYAALLQEPDGYEEINEMPGFYLPDPRQQKRRVN